MRQDRKSIATSLMNHADRKAPPSLADNTRRGGVPILVILIIVFLLGMLVGYGCPLKNSGSYSDSSRSDDDDYILEPRYRDWSI